jgi:hypothetical protein
MEPEPDPSRGSESTAACGSRVRVAIPPGGGPEMLTGFTNANDAAGWNARPDDRRPVVFLLRVSDRSLRQPDQPRWEWNSIHPHQALDGSLEHRDG